MQKGDKEAAEGEKAKAMSIRMSQMARDFAAQQKQEEEVRKRKAEAEQRMGMFKQVLEIDPHDFLANAGMGSALVDSDKYEEAVPYLQKALAVRPTHTVAYRSLAEALEHLGRIDEAIAVYEQGVAIAAQRGDLTPMKAMQSELQRLMLQH
jgi:tetratricopeptide (TPR) repeat protein